MQQEIIQGFRLSSQQKRLWQAQQSVDSEAFRVCSMAKIEGPLDPEILKQSVRRVIGQHEILRTTFRLLPGMTVPVQVIADDDRPSIVEHDLTALSTEEQGARIEQLFLAAARRQIDFARLPLLRLELVKLSINQHALIITAPALCADGPSLQELVQQIAHAYAAIRQGQESAAGESVQYADFAEWQNQLLEGEEGAPARQYWKRIDLSRTLAQRLSFERRSKAPHFQPSAVPITISDETAAQIKVIAADCEAHVSAFVLGCWQTLLWRLMGQDEVTIGVAFDGRKFAELEGAIGLLSSYLPIQICPNSDLQFSALVRQLDEQQREAQRWQEYFSLDHSERSEDGSVTNFLPFSFEFRDRLPSFVVGDLSFSFHRQDACIDRFKIKLVCEEGRKGLSAELQYDTSLFSENDIRRLARELEVLIGDAGKRPESGLIDLALLPGEERHLLLVQFNETTKEFPTGHCIHEMFEAQAAGSPNRVAVICEGERLTYAELNARSNRLAHHLQKLGVGADVRVGLCLDRSVELIEGLLGILKAGGAYVPLDPGLPNERLRAVLEDSGARILVTRSRLADDLRAELQSVVCLDADQDLLLLENVQNPANKISDKNLVYVIFTSGSTGRPEGVAVEHRQLANYVNAIWETLDLPAGASFATVSTIAADLGNTAIFPSLCNGGTLHLITEEMSKNADALANYFGDHQIDCLKITPSHLTALLAASNPAEILPRRRLVLGGEACPWSLIEKLKTLKPDCTVLNHYGPTETTVGAVTGIIDAVDITGSSETIPLGRPIANAQVYILDQRMRPAPIGSAGQLHIGGCGIARGYINRAEATAERFVPNPFGDGERLYQTGDLARYLNDGRIEFLGRVDDQLKVHGYRIEPAEIALALRRYPGISECVVVAREDQPGEKRLVAYVVCQDHQAVAASELRTFLQSKLPEYMMPSAFVFLDRLPLTPNGKVNRSALPPPDYSRPEDEGPFVTPRNQIEEMLAKIWAGVLGVERIGIHDNFFELGGDSILSIQIIARANHAGLRLSPRQLFQHQSIAELALVAGTTASVQAEQGVVTGIVPLTPVQSRFFEQNQPEPRHYNQAMLLQCQRKLDPLLLERALEHLLIQHDALRLRFSRPGGDWQQTIAAPKGAAPFELVDVSDLPEPEQEMAIQQNAARLQGSLNLEEGPLLRVAFFDRGAQRSSSVLIVIHHLTVDGVSWTILLEDLQRLYEQLALGKQIELPAKTTSFKGWAERLMSHAQSQTVRAEAPFWLAPYPSLIAALPIDHHGSNTAASARTLTVSLSADETQVLLQEVPIAFRTQVNEVLLTALMRCFAQWTGSRQLLLELEGHGREDILEGVDLSRTVGWFTTIFPVVLNIGKSSTPVEALRLVKEQLRSIPNRGIGYGLLRYANDAPEIAKKLRALPRAEVRFNYLGQLDRAFADSSVFHVAPESSGPAQSPRAGRAYLLNIIGSVTGGALRLEWTYSENLHRRATVERLAESYVEELRTLITQSRTCDPASYSPYDFPRAKLSQEELSKVLAKLTGSQKEQRQ